MSPSEEALNLALEQRERGDMRAAIDTLFEAVGRDLGDAVLALNLAKMLAESEQLERAEPWFRHALKLAPNDFDLRLAYGTYLGQTGDAVGAREHLGLLMKDLEDTLDQASALGDDAAMQEIRRFLGVASVNLGRAALECGDPAMAIAFARAWQGDAEVGEAAQTLIADALDSDALDPQRLAELSLDGGRVTPAVVTLLIDTALARDPPDFASLERAVAAAQASLPPRWATRDDALARLLAELRVQVGRAIMRGELDPNAHPALMSMHGK